MKCLLIVAGCAIISFANAKEDSTVNSVTIELGKEYRFSVRPPDQGPDYFKIFSVVFPILVALGGIIYQISERRKDDKYKNQLDRLGKQISEFYGPLFSLYETGHRNYYNYLKHFGKDVTFRNPNFKDWVDTVFQPTNIGMESIIINKSDLILGKKIPDFLLQYCKWSATMKVYIKAQLQDSFDDSKWQTILEGNPHPEIQMQAYLCASFEVLKEEQSILLSRNKKDVDEAKLIQEIERRKEDQIRASKDPGTPENVILSQINDKVNEQRT